MSGVKGRMTPLCCISPIKLKIKLLPFDYFYLISITPVFQLPSTSILAAIPAGYPTV